ncbi:transcription factor E2F7/8 [Fistulifera solaris]|uniref:Transcription factor E2F7/8 n=1 Tax=Fistulifera solaris TaxID=1519565 RepID=A0A1Z5JLR3_FISSO|nr:transcription factor E2F7/8 [Fistulifera solaris]|eukprot:GAX14950.1 transcription factor E2F7/8 [Fistulifera solaris]
MSAAVSKTPEPARRNDNCENDGPRSSERVKDLFSPRSAAALALSSFSKQESDFAASQTQAPPSSGPPFAPAMPHNISLEAAQAAMRQASTDHADVFYERKFDPMPSMVPPSVLRRPGLHPSPPNGVRFHYPPHHHYPPNARLHPMSIPNSMPLRAWTPQHRPMPQQASSGPHQEGAPSFRQPMLHSHLPPYVGPWESRPPVASSYQSQTQAMESKARPASEVQSLVTPTPKKARTADTNYNRKKKSLGLLAETFLSRFQNATKGTEVFIDKLASELQVERRRIYDVVNILESLRIVIKKGKNAYQWMGTDHLPFMFAILQHDAIYDHAEDAYAFGVINAKPSDEEIHAAKANHDNKESKSLSRLSQLFLRCYLVGHLTLSLPQASDKIHGEETSVNDLAALGSKNRGEVPTDPKLFQQAAMRGLKTKIRRLYDIANVFISMGLLSKVDERSVPLDSRRPRFSWAYHFSAKEIAAVYEQMPESMKRDRDPFHSSSLPLVLLQAQENRTNMESVQVKIEPNLPDQLQAASLSQLSNSSDDAKCLLLSAERDMFSKEIKHDPELFSNINLTGGAVDLSSTKHATPTGGDDDNLLRIRFGSIPSEIVEA